LSGIAQQRAQWLHHQLINFASKPPDIAPLGIAQRLPQFVNRIIELSRRRKRALEEEE
jgi:hypothetical protein